MPIVVNQPNLHINKLPVTQQQIAHLIMVNLMFLGEAVSQFSHTLELFDHASF